MGVLRGFRAMPRNLRDWASWFARQEIESGLGNPERDGYHLASLADGTRYWEAPPNLEDDDDADTDDGATIWTIKEFDGSYTPIDGDHNNTLLVSTSGSAVNVTIGPDIFPEGAQLTVWQYGAGTVTFVEGSGVDIRTPSGLAVNEQYGSISLIQAFPNDWMFAGRMSS